MTTIGVMTLLEGSLRDEALRLWARFEQDYGSTGVQSFAHPNLTFGGGRCGDTTALSQALELAIRGREPVALRARGIDAFHTPHRAIYLAVEPTEALTALHHTVDEVLQQHCDSLFELYRPVAWVPHITVAMGDLSQAMFDRARAELRGHDHSFEMPVRAFAVVKPVRDGAGFEIVHRWAG